LSSPVSFPTDGNNVLRPHAIILFVNYIPQNLQRAIGPAQRLAFRITAARLWLFVTSNDFNQQGGTT
jgi:hypothetical protein